MSYSNILLIGINAKYIHSNPAIYCLKAYVDRYCTNRPDGCGVSLAEYTINQPVSAVLADLYAKKPDVAAFSCYIWNWEMVQNILLELPKILPDTQIWLGGPEVSFHTEEILSKYPLLTGIMIGEGEETFRELAVYYWTGKGSLLDIKGILYHGSYTGMRTPVAIDSLPFPYDAENLLDAFENRIIYYESQRGCPFRCAYCLSAAHSQYANENTKKDLLNPTTAAPTSAMPDTDGHFSIQMDYHTDKVRLRSLEMVQKELQFFLDHHVKQVKFIDRTFNCNAAHASAIWRYLLEHDNGVTNFHFEIAADLLTEEQLALLAQMRIGLIQLEIGVQSTYAPTLEAINRRMDLDKLRKNVAKVRSFHNIHQHLDLIAGLPYEDYPTFANSFNEVYNMAPHQLQLGFLKVLKGSPMEEIAPEYGIVCQSKPPYEVLYTKWLRFTDTLNLKNIEEMVELYYNSCQFTHTLPVLALEFSSPFQMYEALADYYQDNGYFVNTPARVYCYQVLLDFASATVPEKQQLFAELLTFDLYLRENSKSRPAFAPEYTLSKSMLRQFYKKETEEPRMLKSYCGLQEAQIARMTHIERFSYAVWNGLQNPTECTKNMDSPKYVLFDYKNRDMLSYNAAFFVLEEEDL